MSIRVAKTKKFLFALMLSLAFTTNVASADLASDIENENVSTHTLTGNYSFTADVPALAGDNRNFTIQGAAYNITGGGFAGLSVASGQTLTIQDVSLISNFITDTDTNPVDCGGFLTNAGKVNINALNNNITFTSNKVNGVYSDVYNTGTINLNAKTGQTITFDGVVNYIDDDPQDDDHHQVDGTLVLNGGGESERGGEYHFNSELGGKLNLRNGAVIRLGAYNHETGKAYGEDGYTVSTTPGMQTYGALRLVEFNPGTPDSSESVKDGDHAMVTLDLRNGHVDRHDFGKVTQNASVNHLLDVDMDATDAKKADWFTAESTTAVNGQILLGGFNLLSGSGSEQKIINLSRNSFRFAMALKPGFDIATNITYATEDHYDVRTIDYDSLSGNLILNAKEFTPNGGTIDLVYKTSKEYLEGSHYHYTDAGANPDISSGYDETNYPYVVVINGQVFYFKPKEGTESKNDAIINLAATGSTAIREVTADDNYVFSKDGHYYSYSISALPKSIWDHTEAPDPAVGYNYYKVVFDNNTNEYTTKYYDINLRTDFMYDIDTTKWEKSDSTEAKDYWGTVSPANIPIASSIKPYPETGDLNSVSGMVAFYMPYKDFSTETRYYKYTYTVPDDYTRQTEREVLENNYITNKYFYGLTSSDNGGAVKNLLANGLNINADFIGNKSTVTGDNSGGGAIYNESPGTLGFISGTFINNSASKSGGAINNYKGDIKAIVGDFIGNNAGRAGGAIRNINGKIGMIHGQFIGNSAAVGNDSLGWGGAIASKNDTGTVPEIKIIQGNFIANNVGKGGGAIDINGKLGTVIGDFIANKAGNDGGGAIRVEDGDIGSITGDFIGNSAHKGGAIQSQTKKSESHYGTIYGDFIGNKATNGNGGAINNDSSNSSFDGVYGDFINNSASANGGTIYNKGTMTRVSANFMANKAGGLGGAIYNESGTRALNLIADDYGDILFVGNTDSTGYNDIYNKGIINLNAEKNDSNTHSITFTGTITGSDGKIYINPDSGPQDGNYIFHNTISGNTLFLRKGAKIWLGAYNHGTNKEYGGTDYTVSATPGMQTYGSLDLNALTNDANGGEINSQNGHIEANSLKKVTLGSNIYLKIDADLSVANEDERADNYSATQINANKFIVDSIVVNKDSQTIYTRAKAANDTLKSHYDLSSAILTATSGTGVTNTYKAKYDGTTGYLLFANMTSNLVDQTRNEYGFYEDTRTYNMNANEDIATDITNYGPSASTITSLGELQGTQLTINGNGKSVSGSNNGGISVGSGQTLTMNNIASVSGFVTDGTNNGGFLTNAGTVNINAGNNNVAFSSNKVNSVYNDVYNTGTINLNAAAEKNITFDGAVTGTGTLVLNNDSTVKDGEYHFNSELGGELEMHNGAIIKLGSKEQADSSTTYGTLNLTSLTNDANGGLLDTINDHIDNQNLGSTVLTSDLNLNFDMNLDSLATDTITANYSSGSGKIILSDINLLGSKSWGSFTESELGTKIKILTSNSDSLQLGISSALESTFEANKKLFRTEEKSRVDDVIVETTNWEYDKYKTTIIKDNIYGKWGLAKTTTENDSLGFNRLDVEETERVTMGDTLKLVNQATNITTKNFTAANDGDTYNVSDNLGATKGIVNINGVANGSAEIINLNGKTGFEVGTDAVALNFKDVTVQDSTKTPATTTVATVSNESADIGLNNTILNGNIASSKNYDLTLNGKTTINGTVDNANATINDAGAELKFNTDTFANASLTALKGSLNTKNGTYEDYYIGTLTSNPNARYKLDMSLSQSTQKTDKFITGADSFGTILYITFSSEAIADDMPDDQSVYIQIIKAENNNTQLNYDDSKILTFAKAVMDSSNLIVKEHGLYTKDTTNDSIMLRGAQEVFKAWTNLQTSEHKQFTFLEDAIYTIANTINLDGNNNAEIINNGTVTNEGQLSKFTLTNNGSFTTNAEKIATTGNTITNNGTLTFTGGNNANSISETDGTNSKVIFTGTSTNSGAITQDNVEITSSGNVTNNALIKATSISNEGTLSSAANNLSGTITNDGTLNLTGGINDNIIQNTDATKGIVNLSGVTQNKKNITAKEINNSGTTFVNNSGAILTGNIKNTGNMTANANDLHDTDSSIVNNGVLTLKGGENANAVTTTVDNSTVNFENVTSNSANIVAKTINNTGTEVLSNTGNLQSTTFTNDGKFTNTGAGIITAAITNNGTLTSAAEKLDGSITNSGILNLSGTLNKAISGATGTTYVDSALRLNSGANIAGIFNGNNGNITVSSGSITNHNIGALEGVGNYSLDILYSSGGASVDTITLANDTSDSATVKITGLNEGGITRPNNFTVQVLFGANANTKLDISAIKSQFEGEYSDDKERIVDLTTPTIKWDDNYGTEKWTETYKTQLSVIGSVDGLSDTIKYEPIKIDETEHIFDPKSDNLHLINVYTGTGSNNRSMDFTGIFDDTTAAGTYTVQTDVGTSSAGTLSLNGVKKDTKNTTIDLNTHSGFVLDNVTALEINNIDMKGNTTLITVNNADASITLNNTNMQGAITGNNVEYNMTTTGTNTIKDVTKARVSNTGDLSLSGTNNLVNITETSGTTTVTGGTTTVGSLAQKTLTVEGGATLTNNGDSTVTDGGSNAGTINGSGKLTTGGTFSNTGSIANAISNSGTFTNGGSGITGDVENTAGTFNNNAQITGAVNVTGGTFINEAQITGAVDNGGILTSDISKLESTVNNTGTFNMSGDLSKDITGSGTTVLQSATANVTADRTIQGILDVNSKTLNMSDSAFETLTVGKLSDNGNLTLDVNAQTNQSDEIHVNNAGSSSVLTITTLNLTKPIVTGDSEEYTKRILTGTTTGATLALSSDLQNPVITDISRTGSDELSTNAIKWDDNYGGWKQDGTQTETLSIASSSGTLQDSIKYVLNKDWQEKEYTAKTENLALINVYTGTGSNNRSMDFTGIFDDTTAAGTYTVQTDVGTSSAGTLSLNGVKKDTKNTTIDLNTHSGFVLDNVTALEINNIDMKGNTTLITVNNADASITLNNTNMQGAITGNNVEYNMTTTGTNTIKDVTKARVSNTGDLSLSGTNNLVNITETSGTTTVTGGTTTVGSLAQKTLTVEGGATLTNNGDSTVTDGGSNAGTINGSGKLTTGGTFSNTGSIANAISNSGTFTNGGSGITGDVENTAGTFNNNAQITGAVNVTGGTFTNGGGIDGNVTSASTFINNAKIDGTLTTTGGTFTNEAQITGAVDNGGILTSSVENLGGTINNTGKLNLSGTLEKAISGAGTTVVNSDLTLNSGSSIVGTLDLNNGNINVSSGSYTDTSIGALKGDGNFALDINYSGSSVTSDVLTLTHDSTDSATVKITSITESGTRLADFEKQIIIGANSNTKLDISAIKSQFDKAADDVNKSVAKDLTTPTINWNDNYGTENWIETYKRELSVTGSTAGLLDTIKYESTKIAESAHTFNPKADNLKIMNTYDGTGKENREFNFDSAENEFKITENTGVTESGDFAINGVTDGEVRSIIDYDETNNYKGFELNNDNTTVTLKNVEVKNSSALVSGTSSTGTKVILDNVNIHDNGTGIQTAGDVEIKGNSTISDDIQVTGTNSQIDIDGTDVVNLNKNLTGSGTSKLNISNGTVNIGENADISALDTTLNDTSLNIADENSISGLNTTFNGANNLNISNNKVGTIALGNVNLNGVLKMQIDADLANAQMDKITAASATIGNGGKIEVSKINLLSPTTQKQLDLLFTNNKDLASVVNYTGEGQIAYSPIYKYNTSYIQKGNGSGYFSFVTPGNRYDDFNPSVMASSVTAIVTGYQNQMQSLHDGFYHMERYMKHSKSYRLASENQNKIALLAPVTDLDINKVPETSTSMWTLPYSTFERVNLRGGVKVNNIAYGMTYGGDSDMFDMRNGFKGLVSAFVGYNGNHMTYDGISMTQNGGFLGMTFNAYKGNFFTGLTVSTGASTGDADTMYGHDNITLLTAGVANKTGYNFEILEGKIILQPSLFLGYSWVNTFDYTNSAGVRINQDALNALQIVPGVKLIGNTKNGWQPYAGVDMVWNVFMGRNEVRANNVVLPQLSERAYVQYGVGIQKTWADRFTGFLQAMVRNGGRNGVSLNVGFRWKIGGKNNKNQDVKKEINVKDKQRIEKNNTNVAPAVENKTIKQDTINTNKTEKVELKQNEVISKPVNSAQTDNGRTIVKQFKAKPQKRKNYLI